MDRVMTMVESEINNVARSMNENRDCAVRAVAIVSGVDYRAAHAALKAEGRKDRCGTYPVQYCAALTKMGFEARKIEFRGATVRTIGSQLRRGKFLVRVSRHVLAVVDGKVMDWTEGRLHRVKDVYEVVPAGSPIDVAPVAVKSVNKIEPRTLINALLDGAEVNYLARIYGADTNAIRSQIDKLRRHGFDIRNVARGTFKLMHKPTTF